VQVSFLTPSKSPLKIRGVKMGFRIVAWMERSGIQEDGMGRGRGNCVCE